VIASLVCIALIPSVNFWILPPQVKFARAWKTDIDLLNHQNAAPKAFGQIREIHFRSDESRIYDWYQATTTAPIPTKKDGKYRLEILALSFIDGYRYGAILQYNWVDLESGNTVGEFGRTLRLGLIY